MLAKRTSRDFFEQQKLNVKPQLKALIRPIEAFKGIENPGITARQNLIK
jgi:hypothetical protein